MAIHYDVSFSKLKIINKIELAIKRDFDSGKYNGSLKYQKLRDVLSPDNYKNYKESENDEVYLTERYIGKHIIFGGGRCTIEIHFDTKDKKILKIYLVA